MSQDLNRYFQAEAEDLLGRITAALERFAQEPVTPESLRDLRRWTHTLKGAAQVVRREPIARGAHRLETVLDALGDPQTGAAALRDALTLTAEMTQELVGSEQPLRRQGAAPAREAEREQPSIENLRIGLSDLDGLLQAVGESAITASGLRHLFGPLERARELASMLREGSQGIGHSSRMQHAEVIAEEIADVLEEIRRGLDVAAEQMQRELEGLRLRAENLRLVRAESMIQVLEQSARGAAASAGKTIDFIASGGEIELDAHLLIAARDALIQVVRNAVAHGIEDAAGRAAAGKPAAGQIRVEFRREGSSNVLAVSDDGRGIDFEALRVQAVRRGWMTPAQAGEATAQDLTEFLLRPGVTTAGSAGVLAGRGVGLDLVSSMVARLKGELRITAEPGRGTTVEIRVRASMNSAAVLMISAAGMDFGVPLDAVRRAASIAALPRLGDRFVVDGRALALASLGSIFGVAGASPSVAVEVIVQSRAFLLGVDALRGIRQTIIHTLPDFLEAEPFVLGASIDADGHARLILDPVLLASRLDDLARRSSISPAEPSPSLPILVVDDSLTTRMLEQSIFEMEGYTVDLASSAEEALEMARKREYGLFLVDVEMPGVDGVTFVEETRCDPDLRETPAILVTSRSSAEDRARGLAAGAREYVVKSEFDQRFLLNRVRELMRTR